MWAAIWTDLASPTRTSFLVASTWPELAAELQRWIEDDVAALERLAASQPPAEPAQVIQRARTCAERVRRHLADRDVMRAVAQLVEYRSGGLSVNYGPAIRCGARSLEPAVSPSAN